LGEDLICLEGRGEVQVITCAGLDSPRARTISTQSWKSHKEGQEEQGKVKELKTMLHQLLGSLRKSQKEGLEDQGNVKELGGTPSLGVRRKPLHLF